jgi:DNA-binding NarL/FixJ family response regulator
MNTSNTALRILLADDHPVYRKGLRAVLEATPYFQVVAEVSDGESALEAIARDEPDVAILDLDMPGKDGLQVATEVRDRQLRAKVVLLTGHKSESLVNKAIDAGVMGYVLKEGALSEIIECARTVHDGHRYVSPQLATVLLPRRARAESLVARTPSLEDLTATERKVLALVGQAKTSKEIGAILFISARTVEHHRASIASKLNLRGTNALVTFAIEHKSELAT